MGCETAFGRSPLFMETIFAGQWITRLGVLRTTALWADLIH